MSAYTSLRQWCDRIAGTDFYRVLDPVIWEVGAEGSGLLVRVPVGFVFDISVPRGLRWILSAHDRRVLKAAALHDHLLCRGWDRVTAAAAFHDALLADGVGRRLRFALWLCVSIWRWR